MGVIATDDEQGDISGDEVYEMEDILDYKREHNQDFYHVKWKGYSEAEATWEPRANILNPGDHLQMRMVDLKNRTLMNARMSLLDDPKRKSAPVSRKRSPGRESSCDGSSQPENIMSMQQRISKKAKASSTFTEGSSSSLTVPDHHQTESSAAMKPPAAAAPAETAAQVPASDSLDTAKKALQWLTDSADAGSQSTSPSESAPNKVAQSHVDSGKQRGRHYNSAAAATSSSSSTVDTTTNNSFPRRRSVLSAAGGTVKVSHISKNTAGHLLAGFVKGDSQKTEWISLDDASVQYPRELLDYLIARIKFRDNNAPPPPASSSGSTPPTPATPPSE